MYGFNDLRLCLNLFDHILYNRRITNFNHGSIGSHYKQIISLEPSLYEFIIGFCHLRIMKAFGISFADISPGSLLKDFEKFLKIFLLSIDFCLSKHVQCTPSALIENLINYYIREKVILLRYDKK